MHLTEPSDIILQTWTMASLAKTPDPTLLCHHDDNFLSGIKVRRDSKLLDSETLSDFAKLTNRKHEFSCKLTIFWMFRFSRLAATGSTSSISLESQL